MREHLPTMAVNPVSVDPRITSAIDHMTQELDRAWTVSELADSVGLSPTRLRYLFIVCIGVSPLHYLKHHKMCAAEQLLRSSQLKVAEIMKRVGISDASHFTRDFTAKFGASPTTYRRIHGRRCSGVRG